MTTATPTCTERNQQGEPCGGAIRPSYIETVTSVLGEPRKPQGEIVHPAACQQCGKSYADILSVPMTADDLNIVRDRLSESTRQALQAAATELRRAHEFWTDEFRGRWSHGDATTQNVLYDAKTDRARLIDFEIVHDKSLPTATRQADDLLVFLLDMVGRVPSRKWIPFATTFLKTYGDAKVIHELGKQLDLPGGLAWIWWGVRTNFADPAKVKHRLTSLSRAIRTLKLDQAVPAVRVRHKRRPSINCHVIKPGIPRPSSRRRVMSESAKALSPGIPRRPPTKT